MSDAIIVPSRPDVEAWKLEAETAIRFGGVERLGQFNWPQAVMSLVAEWEKSNVAPPIKTYPVTWRDWVRAIEAQGVRPTTVIRSIDWRKWQRCVVWKAAGEATINDVPHPEVKT